MKTFKTLRDVTDSLAKLLEAGHKLITAQLLKAFKEYDPEVIGFSSTHLEFVVVKKPRSIIYRFNQDLDGAVWVVSQVDADQLVQDLNAGSVKKNIHDGSMLPHVSEIIHYKLKNGDEARRELTHHPAFVNNLTRYQMYEAPVQSHLLGTVKSGKIPLYSLHSKPKNLTRFKDYHSHVELQSMVSSTFWTKDLETLSS